MDLSGIPTPESGKEYTPEQVERVLKKMVIKKEIDKATGKDVYVAWAVMKTKDGNTRTVKITIYNAEASEDKKGGGLDEVVKTIKAFQHLSKKIDSKTFRALFFGRGQQGSEWRTVPAQGDVNKVALQRFNPDTTKRKWLAIATDRFAQRIFIRDTKEKHFMYTYDTQTPSDSKSLEKLPLWKRWLKKPIVFLSGGMGASYLFTTRSKQIESIAHLFAELYKKPGFEKLAQEKIQEMQSGEISKPIVSKPLEIDVVKNLNPKELQEKLTETDKLLAEQKSRLKETKSPSQRILLAHQKDYLDYQKSIYENSFIAKSLNSPDTETHRKLQDCISTCYSPTIEHMSLIAKQHFELTQLLQLTYQEISEKGSSVDLEQKKAKLEDQLFNLNTLLSNFKKAIDKQSEMLEFIWNVGVNKGSSSIIKYLENYAKTKHDMPLESLSLFFTKFVQDPLTNQNLTQIRTEMKNSWKTIADIITPKQPINNSEPLATPPTGSSKDEV